MAFCPPSVPATSEVVGPRLGAGVHAVTLANFVQAPTSKEGKYYVAYIATYRAEDGSEIDEWIRFTGKKSDYYSGLRIELLCTLFDAPIPEPGEDLDPAGLLALAEGIGFQVEVVQNGQYFNVTDVRGEGIPF